MKSEKRRKDWGGGKNDNGRISDALCVCASVNVCDRDGEAVGVGGGGG